AVVAESAKIWDHAQIRERAVVGDDCIIGRSAYIGIGVRLDWARKIHNHALAYEFGH
ncbi:MAG: N-acetyltransferase, partial [Acidimicrobiaceae bacterium]